MDVKDGPFKKSQRKRIVHGSRGVSCPGELLAVMGPSGAGKTTLFNSLAKRGQGYYVTGELTLNGSPYEKHDLMQISGFVFQDALLHSHIQVHEVLRTAARLKLPREMSDAEKDRRVETLMDAFDLRRCALNKVSGVSGGEKKRLSIAIETLTGPALLFLDEPTSGLGKLSLFLCSWADGAPQTRPRPSRRCACCASWPTLAPTSSWCCTSRGPRCSSTLTRS